MRLGVDLGTTRVVVAAADRGNYPVVTFDAPDGSGCEYFPSLVAARNGEFRTGFDAVESVKDPSWKIRRSLKRALADAGPMDELGGRPVAAVVRHVLRDLANALRTGSNLDIANDEPLEVAIAVPANATANQRMMTVDAFRDSGFRVVRVVDEPSAAGLEYAWRRPRDAQVRRRHVAVYDLGGGTFDASVIAVSDDLHEVLTTEGIRHLGGDDFDRVLLDLATAQAGLELPNDGSELDLLLERCREEKERFGPNTRRLNVEVVVGMPPIEVATADYEAALAPLVTRTLEALGHALESVYRTHGEDVERSTVIYQIGGASALPPVGRALRECYGRRVWRSPYPHASVAIGLAIAAEEDTSPRVSSCLTRHFGVWRELDGGRRLSFDHVFAKDLPLPPPGASPLVTTRRYRAAHDIGHFRFVEASRLTGDGSPAGDLSAWHEVRFPFEAALYRTELEHREVHRIEGEGPLIEERYTCDGDGVIRVEIRHLEAGYSMAFDLHGTSLDL
jgi:molecular chaperone DnaK (HSP70)